MTEEDLKALQATGNAVSSVFQSLDNINSAEANIIDTQNKLKYTEKHERIAATNKENFDFMKNQIIDERDDNEVEIKNLVKEIANWNIVAEDWEFLDEDDKTQTGKDILKEKGLIYGKNFKYREMFAANARESLNNTRNLIELQETIINDLETKKNKILELQNDWIKVGVDAAGGIAGIKDEADVKDYMLKPENREKFGISDDSDSASIDWVNDTNQLAKAFLKRKDGAYGFVENATPSMYKAAGVNPKTGKYLAQETSINLVGKMRSLKSAVTGQAITDDSSDAGIEGLPGGKTSEYLNELGIEDLVRSLNTNQNHYAGDGGKLNAKDDREKVGTAIIAMFDEAINNDDYRTDDETKALLAELDLFDKGESGNPKHRDSNFTRYAVRSLVDRYIADDKFENRDMIGNIIGHNFIPRPKIQTSLTSGGAPYLNKEFAEDKIHFDKDSDLEGNRWGLFREKHTEETEYGTDDNSLVFYRLLDYYDSLDKIVEGQ